jgi:phosphatidylserine synthase 2
MCSFAIGLGLYWVTCTCCILTTGRFLIIHPIGMRTCAYFEVKVSRFTFFCLGRGKILCSQHYVWRGLRETRGLRHKSSRVIKQLTPRDWTTFEWEGTASFQGFVSVVLLLTIFLAAELNVFYLKALLWMEPDHRFVIARLAAMFVCALPAVREFYQYMHDSRYLSSDILLPYFRSDATYYRKVVRMGQHAWLLLATVTTELLLIFKWGRGQFPLPFPLSVKICAVVGVVLLLAYPALKVSAAVFRQGTSAFTEYWLGNQFGWPKIERRLDTRSIRSTTSKIE